MLDSQYFHIFIELFVGFFALFFVTRYIRKTQINNITPFDFISAVVLGELLGNGIYDQEINIVTILFAIISWGLLMLIVELTTIKFRRTRKMLDGDPAIIIRNGQIDYQVVKKEKLDLNELLSALRKKDAFSVREIEYAIVEPSGEISVLKKSKYASAKYGDLDLPDKPVYLSANLILDGEIIMNNLHTLGFDLKWLKKQMKIQNIDRVEDVFYAEWKQDEGLHVVLKNEK